MFHVVTEVLLRWQSENPPRRLRTSYPAAAAFKLAPVPIRGISTDTSSRSKGLDGRRHLGCPHGGMPGTARLDLQGIGEVHEDPLGFEDERDGQQAPQGCAESVEARIGAHEVIDPPVPRPAPRRRG